MNPRGPSRVRLAAGEYRMAELVILIGLQASGKSTFYRTRLAATHGLVSKDLLRNNPRPARRQAQLIREALAGGRSVAVDNTNATVELRRELIELGREFGAVVTGYYFAAKVEECLVRNALREGKARVPEVGVFATLKSLARPSRAEGFDRLFHVSWDASGTTVVSEWCE